MNQWKLEVSTCSWCEGWEIKCEWIGFGFTSDWIKKSSRSFLSQLCSLVGANFIKSAIEQNSNGKQIDYSISIPKLVSHVSQTGNPSRVDIKSWLTPM